ncbi:hypothetical protein D3C84_957620 [compost metagenome]
MSGTTTEYSSCLLNLLFSPDTICRDRFVSCRQTTREGCEMLKNVLATVGLAVVLKASFDLYLKYKQMERENDIWRKSASGGE